MHSENSHLLVISHKADNFNLLLGNHQVCVCICYVNSALHPCPNLLTSFPVKGKEAWDYVDVRDGAHMFWWLYYANSSSASFQDLPLVMWLQVRLSHKSFSQWV